MEDRSMNLDDYGRSDAGPTYYGSNRNGKMLRYECATCSRPLEVLTVDRERIIVCKGCGIEVAYAVSIKPAQRMPNQLTFETFDAFTESEA
jgi:DNA-directed RNA polymerase subunit RPC12/RpoP